MTRLATGRYRVAFSPLVLIRTTAGWRSHGSNVEQWQQRSLLHRGTADTKVEAGLRSSVPASGSLADSRDQPGRVPVSTPTYTEAQLRACAMHWPGRKRVTFGDKTVEYRSIDELTAAIHEVEVALQGCRDDRIDSACCPADPHHHGEGFWAGLDSNESRRRMFGGNPLHDGRRCRSAFVCLAAEQSGPSRQ